MISVGFQIYFVIHLLNHLLAIKHKNINGLLIFINLQMVHFGKTIQIGIQTTPILITIQTIVHGMVSNVAKR